MRSGENPFCSFNHHHSVIIPSFLSPLFFPFASLLCVPCFPYFNGFQAADVGTKELSEDEKEQEEGSVGGEMSRREVKQNTSDEVL